MRRPTRGELQGVTVRWLLTVESLGRTSRWSSSPCVVTDATAGESYPYRGGLPRIEVQVIASPGESVSEPQAINVEIPWPDVQDYLGRGLAIRGTAELAWWPAGVDWRDRHVVMIGTITVATSEAPGDPVTLTISPDAAVETREWPPPEYAVTEESWPSSSGSPGGPMPQDIGLTYPVPLGSPGQHTVTDPVSALYGSLVQYPGSPVHRVQTDLTIGTDRVYETRTVLISIGRVKASTVEIVYPATGSASGWYAETFTVIHTRDALGRVVSTCDVSGATAASIRTAEVLYASWADNFATVRQSLIGDDGSAITGAGGVIEYLMRRSSVPFSAVDWAGVRAYLDSWRVGTYIDEPTPPWTWVAEVILPGLPVSAVPGPSGVRPVLWRPTASAHRAVDHIRVGHDAARAGPLILRSVDESTARIDYAVDADTGEARQQVVVAPVAVVAESVAATVWARDARDLLASEGSTTTMSSWAGDRGTAYAIAAWRTALAAGWYELDVDVDQDRGYLQHGDEVQITDAEVGLSARPAQVAGITYRDSGILTLRLVIWRDPALSFAALPLLDSPEPPPPQ